MYGDEVVALLTVHMRLTTVRLHHTTHTHTRARATRRAHALRPAPQVTDAFRGLLSSFQSAVVAARIDGLPTIVASRSVCSPMAPARARARHHSLSGSQGDTGRRLEGRLLDMFESVNAAGVDEETVRGAAVVSVRMPLTTGRASAAGGPLRLPHRSVAARAARATVYSALRVLRRRRIPCLLRSGTVAALARRSPPHRSRPQARTRAAATITVAIVATVAVGVLLGCMVGRAADNFVRSVQEIGKGDVVTR